MSAYIDTIFNVTTINPNLINQQHINPSSTHSTESFGDKDDPVAIPNTLCT